MNWSTYLPTNRIIFISRGGGAGAIDDNITELAKEFGEESPAEIFYGYGVPVCWPPPVREKQAKDITKKIVEIYDKIENQANVRPQVILVGKSMGGCILHQVSLRLYHEGINVDLFIGVDMSCTVDCHYKKYEDDPNEAKIFYDNVKNLMNFYQIHDESTQCGHPAIYKNSHLDENKININVNNSKYDMTNKVRTDLTVERGLSCSYVEITKATHRISVNVDNQRVDRYDIRFKYKCDFANIFNLCAGENNGEGVQHGDIDTCPGLLTVIKRLIKEEINLEQFPYDDNIQHPKFTLSYTSPSGNDSGSPYEDEKLSLDDTEKHVIVNFNVGPTEIESYKREVTVVLNTNECQHSLVIQLREPFNCVSPYVGDTPSLADCLDTLHTVFVDAIEFTSESVPDNIDQIQSDRFLYIYAPPSYVDPDYYSVLLDNAGMCGLEPKLENYINKQRSKHCHMELKWGFVKVPVKCKIIEKNLLDGITRDVKIEESINGGEFIEKETKIINENELDSFTLVNGFTREDYDNDKKLRFTFTSKDATNQVAETILVLYAKCLIHEETCSSAILIGKDFDDDEERDNWIKEIRPKFSKGIIDGLIESDRRKVKSNLSKFYESITDKAFSIAIDLRKDKNIVDKINDVIKEEVKLITKDCAESLDSALNKDDARNSCASRRAMGYFNIREKAVRLINLALFNKLKDYSKIIIENL